LRVVWSYSVFGKNQSRYYKPLLQNFEIARKNGIQILLSTTDTYQQSVNEYFSEYSDVYTLCVYDSAEYKGREEFLRFLSVDSAEADYYFFKDSDSYVDDREQFIMNHWMMYSGSSLFIIRDSPVHVAPILAGMFGIHSEMRDELCTSCRGYMSNEGRTAFYGNDQRWLAECIYPAYRHRSSVYTSYFSFCSERVTILPRVKEQAMHIGAFELNHTDHGSTGKIFFRIYGNKMLCIPFLRLPALFFRLLYGRVWPTILIARFLGVFRKNVYQVKLS
jgi:hypothetical protein